MRMAMTMTMKFTPGLGSAIVFAVSLLTVVLLGFILPHLWAPANGTPRLTPWMYNGIVVSGAIAVCSAPFAWRGILNQVTKSRQNKR